MWVRSLNLARYGAFTGRAVEFGPGLTVVVGVNEAGKSTALEALSDLLWGIPAKSAQAYLHGHQALAIEAVLSLPDGEINVVRRSGGLTDVATGQAVPCHWQGDDTRARWRTSFGLAHTDLREGGRALFRGEGDLAQLVFAARSGRAVRQLLEQIEREADSLYKDHRNSKNVRVRQAGAEYEQARSRVDDATAKAHQVLAVRQGVDQAKREVERAAARRKAAESELAGRTARFGIATEARRLADVRSQVDALRAVGPFLGGAELQVWDDATVRLRSAEAAIAELEVEFDELVARRASVVVEREILADRSLIRRLDRDCRARLADGQRAVDLRAKADSATLDVAELLGSLAGRDNRPVALESLRIPDDRLAQLDELANELSQAGKALRQQREMLDDAVRRRARADAEIVAMDTAAVAAVREVYTAIQSDGSAVAAQRRALATLADAQLRRDNSVGLAGLSAVPAKIPTASSVRAATELLTARRAELLEAQRRLVATELVVATTRAALADAASGDVPDPDDLVRARRERDESVAELVAAWLGGRPASEVPDLLGRVERTTGRADAVADRLVTHAEAAARRAELARSLSAAESEAARVASEVDGIAGEVAGAEQAWAVLWEGVSPPPRPAEAVEVRLLVVEARAAESEMAVARGQVDGLRAQVERQHAGLSSALARAGRPRPEADLDSLLEAARSLLETDDAAREARARVDQLVRNVSDAREQHRCARRAYDDVLVEWRSVLVSVGVQGDLDDTGWARRRDIVGRAQAREREAESYREEARQAQDLYDGYLADVAVVARRHGVDDVSVAVAVLAQRLERADAAEVEARELDRRIGVLAGDVEGRRRDRVDALARLGDLGVDVVDVDGAAERGRRLGQLGEDVGRLTELIRVAVPGVDVDEVVRELAASEPEVLRASVAEAEAELVAADGELAAALRNQGEASQRERDLTGRVGAGELRAEAEERLASLTESVERYLVAHIQRTVLRAELEAYERKHASPLLEEAGRVLAGLTGGRYVALRAAGRSLVVVGADEEIREHGQLSEGTADQVFLALRLAGIASLQRDRCSRGLPALPVVLDDVLMTFDDERAAAALRVMAGLAQGWQVIVLSHHGHVGEVAEGLGLGNVAVARLAGAVRMVPGRAAGDIRAVGGVVGVGAGQGVGVSAGVVRAWARESGYRLSDRGRIPVEVTDAYVRAHG